MGVARATPAGVAPEASEEFVDSFKDYISLEFDCFQALFYRGALNLG